MSEAFWSIAPENHWALWGVILATAALCLWAEQTRLGKHLNAYILCIAAAAILANLGVIPINAPAYDVVWSYAVPLGIAMLLFHADLRKILKESGLMLGAFAIASVGTVLGTIVAFYIVPLDDEARRMTASFCATYIGGSLNYVMSADAIGLKSGDLLSAGVAADNVLTSIFILALFAIAGSQRLAKLFVQRKEIEAPEGAGAATFWDQRPVSLRDMAISIAIAWAICAVGMYIAPWFDERTGLANTSILIITVIVVAVASILPKQLGKLHGGEVMGAYLMNVFFVVLGASAHIPTVMQYGVNLFIFAGVILAVHLVFTLVVGGLLRFDLRELILASNASIGGPPTAVAMAAAKGWDKLITPTVLCGTLGYAIGTFIGLRLATWLGAI